MPTRRTLHADGRPMACPTRTATPAAANLMPPTLPRMERCGTAPSSCPARGSRTTATQRSTRRSGANGIDRHAMPVEKRGTAVSRTARLPRRVLVPTALSLLAAASLVLSGCAAGQYSQTADQVAAIDGANGTVGDIAVLNARLAPTERENYPAGSDARLLLWISNDSLNRRHAEQRQHLGRRFGEDHRRSGGSRADPRRLRHRSGHRGHRHRLLPDLFYGNSIPMTFYFANAGSPVAEHPDPASASSAPPTGRPSTSCRRTRPRSGKQGARRGGRGRRRRGDRRAGGAAETTSESGTDRRPRSPARLSAIRPGQGRFRTAVGPPVYGSRHEINHARSDVPAEQVGRQDRPTAAASAGSRPPSGTGGARSARRGAP